jgi:hypothetical protein
MAVSPKTVHAWLSDPDGSKARERKQRLPRRLRGLRRALLPARAIGEAWRCETCDRTHRHEQRQWTAPALSLGQSGVSATV